MSTPAGLYEALITELLSERLSELGPGLQAQLRDLRAEEAADRLALHLARTVERALADLPDSDRVATGVALVRRLLDLVGGEVSAGDRLAEPAQVLAAILERAPDGRSAPIGAPLIPLLDTTLVTNSPREPRVGSQIAAEIQSAQSIDLVMAFIRSSGIRPIEGALAQHCERNAGALRVLTTTYTGSTELAALEKLAELGADVRVSYDTRSTRLHAKAWLFHRASGYSTAYIGSSNLTHSAQVDGLEWNVRVSGARNPDVIRKMASVFEAYWQSPDFLPFDADEFARYAESTRGPTALTILSPAELRLEPFQERLLEQIQLARARGRHTNLLVAATGTGKTVMAAIDYVRLRRRLKRACLLFVAHRKEILEQSLATFRHAMRDAAFGELWVDGQRPRDFDHVFASIQTLGSNVLEHLEPERYDVVVIDEIHHGAANSYAALLDHIRPRELLGLTATPERSDGQSILGWFGGEIAASLRLWDAIEQQRLVPFRYWGVADGVDLTDVPWTRGRGYDVAGLTNVFTADDVWASRVLGAIVEFVPVPASMRALGFCVSIEHARFMARVFNAAGVPALAVWSDSPRGERAAALRALAAGDVRVVFSVDLFNEGVNVPDVDTLLLLRPTDSPVLYMQQLGRGLRRAEGKSVCTVIDFVAQHRREFRYDRRLRALIGGTRKSLRRQIEAGFPFLPAGCHMAFDRMASERVLDNLRRSLPTRWREKAAELRALVADGHGPSLGTFLDESGMELEDIYTGGRGVGWSSLIEAAGLVTKSPGPHESTLRAAVGRLLHVDDARRIERYRSFVGAEQPPSPDALDERERRLLRMLVASLANNVLPRECTAETALGILWSHPQVLAETEELLGVLADRITHVHRPLGSHELVPLEVHARYTRLEILAAFGAGTSARVAPWQSGVQFIEAERTDLLAFTLDKSSGGFSPTTRYRDYAISPELIHWESQSVTRADSETGLRFQNHARMGSSIMLFARETVDERAFWFLGPGTYVKHESECPMAITWRLEHPLPGDLFASFAAAVA